MSDPKPTTSASLAVNKAKDKANKAKQPLTPAAPVTLERYGPAPMGRRPKRRIHPCGCGCGELTASAFAPGHDGRLSGWFRRLTEDLTLEQLPPQAQRVYAAWVKAGRPGGLEHPVLKDVVLAMRAAVKK